MENSLTKSKGLNGNIIKYIAIVAMLIDHIAWTFVPFGSVLGQFMHIIGRITAPTMCYFIAEGYYHTRNVKKYAIRLGIFALISHCPFILFECGKPFVFELRTSVIYSLFLGLIALWIWDKVQNETLKVISIVCICVLAMPGDWMCCAILWVLAYGANRGNFKKQVLWFSVVSIGMVLFMCISNVIFTNGQKPFYSQLFQLGVFLSLPFISLYNGQRGKSGKFNKWLFYIFYPAHLLIIGIIAILIK